MTSKLTDGEEPATESLPVVATRKASKGHRKSVAQLFEEHFETQPKADIVPVVTAEVMRPISFEDEVLAIDKEIFDRASGVVSAALRFAEVEMTEEGAPAGPPEAWVKEYGSQEKAKVMHRVATLANLPKTKMPAGLDIGARVYVGMVKARSEKTQEQPLNLTLVHIETSDKKYPERIV